LAYPSRGGFGGESGGDPLRGQHRRVPPDLGGMVSHEVRECHQFSVAGRITNAVPSAGARVGEAITERDSRGTTGHHGTKLTDCV